MVSRREEFFRDVRRAARDTRKSAVFVDSRGVGASRAASALRRADPWLTPRVVEAFRADDFAGETGDVQTELLRAVEHYRDVASSVPDDQPASDEQHDRGLAALHRLLDAVRRVVVEEWQRAVATMVGDTQAWCGELGWRVRRDVKEVTETLLGTYAVPRLLIYDDQQLYALDPIGRFVPNALGAAALSIQPSYVTTGVYRRLSGDWFIQSGAERADDSIVEVPLNKDGLRRAVEELRSAL